jgi:hypothetical protein
MLFSTALRLAAIECLCPTAAIAGQAAFPTLAGGTVFDSKRPEIGDLDKSKKYTPVVSIYSGEATSILRGEAAASNDRAATATLEFVAELAEAVPAEGGETYAEAMVTTDQDARVVLDALVAQIRRTLEYAPAGALFRKMRIGSPVKITCEPHVVPELDLRFCRTFVTMEFSVPDDVYADAAGLPEPAATLLASLPAGSYSKARLTALAAAFDQIDRDALTEIRLDPGAGPTAGTTLE